MGREKTDQMNAESGTPDSTATMIKRSLKTGVKSALESVGGGGMADRSRKAIKASKEKTEKSIDDQS